MQHFDWVITFDMDKQHDPNFLKPMVEKIVTVAPRISMISGSRFLSSDLLWATPWKDRFLVNCFLSAVLFQFKVLVSDAFCGFKAIRTTVFTDFELHENGYEMPIEFWIKFTQAGHRYIEVPVPLIYAPRTLDVAHESDLQMLISAGRSRINTYLDIIEKRSC